MTSISINSHGLVLNQPALGVIERTRLYLIRLLPQVSHQLARLHVHVRSVGREKYSAAFSLFLPSRQIIIAELGQTAGQALTNGFRRLVSQVKKYKERYWFNHPIKNGGKG